MKVTFQVARTISEAFQRASDGFGYDDPDPEVAQAQAERALLEIDPEQRHEFRVWKVGVEEAQTVHPKRPGFFTGAHAKDVEKKRLRKIKEPGK